MRRSEKLRSPSPCLLMGRCRLMAESLALRPTLCQILLRMALSRESVVLITIFDVRWAHSPAGMM